MTASLGPFGDWAETAQANGFIPIPMSGKRPLLNGWNGRPLGRRAIRSLIDKGPQYAAANMGFRTGKLVAVDIDVVDRDFAARIANAAMGMLGPTPFIRIGSYPRRMLFYRSEADVTTQRVGKVEILGKGKVAVVLGTHPDTDLPYRWPEECIVDCTFSDVPLVTAKELDFFVRWLEFAQSEAAEIAKERVARIARKSLAAGLDLSRQAGGVTQGQRNDVLFSRLMSLAVRASSETKLMTEAIQINRHFTPPLPTPEVQRVVSSVWRYKCEGRVMVRGRQQVVLPLGKDDLLRTKNAAATHLVAVLKATRKTKTFTIPQKATAKALGWGSNRVAKAIGSLIAEGWLRKLPQTGNAFGQASRYEWGE